jgi:putative SbcD/Mre11-related phosphoesterase
MKLEQIPNEPALLIWNKIRILVVADLHIGIEAELKEKGFNLPSQTEKIVSKLLMLCADHEIDELIILGDMKHNVPLTSRQEFYEIPSILKRLDGVVNRIHITPGNHDGNLMKLLPKRIDYHGSKGFVYEKVGFFHGHTWPSVDVMNCDHVILAHEHPTIQFIETLGGVDYRRVWVKAKLNGKKVQKKYPGSKSEILILPAFNDLCTGTAINDQNSKYLGPILTNELVDMENAEIYLLDGTFVGNLRDLEK